jgi:succinate dehydrogenase / fumarate reductase membrane anchor subunit
MTDQNKPSLQNPLGRARGLGSAKDGTHHWMMQRLTAFAMIPLTLFMAYALHQITAANYTTFVVWITQPMVAIALILFVLISFYHAALGLQVIIEDYVHTPGLKILILIFNKLFFFTLGVACLYAIVAINAGFKG